MYFIQNTWDLLLAKVNQTMFMPSPYPLGWLPQLSPVHKTRVVGTNKSSFCRQTHHSHGLLARIWLLWPMVTERQLVRANICVANKSWVCASMNSLLTGNPTLLEQSLSVSEASWLKDCCLPAYYQTQSPESHLWCWATHQCIYPSQPCTLIRLVQPAPRRLSVEQRSTHTHH